MKTNYSSTKYKEQCHDWIFNTSVFNSTIASEWNLACDKEYLVSLTATIYMLGFFCGCLVLGDLSDRYGRRLMFLSSSLLTLVSAVSAAFSVSYAMFAVLRFFVGVGVAGTRNSAYILQAEFARPKDRGTLGLVSDVTYSIAYISIGGIFYLDPNWRRLQLYIGASTVVYLTYFFFMPESPRWNLSKHRPHRALQYFRTSARVNGKTMPACVTITPTVVLTNQKSVSILALVRTPNLRRVGFVCFSQWFLVSLVYFGMSFNVSNLKGSIYVNNSILGAVEIAANFVGIWVVKLGRRPSTCGAFLIAAVSMTCIIFTKGNYYAVIALAMIGKFVISPAFSFIYISTAELYPTTARTLALGVGSGIARLGGALAPYIHDSYQVWTDFPYVIFAGCGALGAFLSLFIPETMDRQLPESIQDAEEMNTINWPCTKTKLHTHDTAINQSDTDKRAQHIHSENVET